MSEFAQNRMVITYSRNLKSITNLTTGFTFVLNFGQMVEMWPPLSIDEFEQRQSTIQNTYN